MSNEEKKADNSNLEMYWSNRYLNQMIGWDLGAPSGPIVSYIDQLKDKEIKILIPGAGNAYEAEYLYKKGFKNVFIIDISEIPLNNFSERIPEFPKDQIICGDFFDLKDQYDIIIEQTFFCSFPPIDNNREKYVKKMVELLKPKGKLVGLWFDIPLSNDLTKRPFGGTKEEYLKLFSGSFKVLILDTSYNSVESRKGLELFGILRRKPF